MKSVARRGFAGALAAAVLAGCALIVSPPDVSGTCHFDGESAACGGCIARACQAQVDACCGAPSCSGALGSLDTCARTGDCVALYAEHGSTEASALAACAAGSCTSACAGGDGGDRDGTGGDGPATDSREDSPSNVDAAVATVCHGTQQGECGCSVSHSAGNTIPCSPAGLGAPPASVVCCADDGYPTAAGATCTCGLFGCAAISGPCLCLGLSRLDNTTPACAVEEWTCCARKGALDCTCDFQVCASDSVTVANCSVAALLCPTGQHAMSECR